MYANMNAHPFPHEGDAGGKGVNKKAARVFGGYQK